MNFLIPELASGIQYRKGTYAVDSGDFSAAGAIRVNYLSVLDGPIVRLEGGAYGYARVLAAASPEVGGGHLLVAAEAMGNDGPWDRPDVMRRWNGLVRYSRGTATSGLSLTALAYHANWNSSDQIPERAVEDGSISRFGYIDPHRRRHDAPRRRRAGVAAHDRCRRDARGGLRLRLRPRPVLELHLLPRRSREGRPVRAVRRPVRVRRARESREAGEPVRPALARHRRRRPAARRDWRRRAVPDRGARAPLDGPRGHGRADERRGVRAGANAVVRRRADDDRAARRPVPLERGGQRPGQRRHRDRRHREPQVQRRPRPVAPHGTVRERRRRLPQQRRPRRDDPA